MRQIVVGITGASGAAYAKRLCELLLQAKCRVHVIVSPNGAGLLAEELGLADSSAAGIQRALGDVAMHDYHRLADPLSSGSAPTDGMAVCPCSCNTLADLAAGSACNLLTRAAAVHLKERRPLVVVPREMPVSAIDLENQLRLSRAGAIIAPACPGFYRRPQRVSDLVDFVAARVCQCLGVPHGLDLQYRTLE